MINVGVHRAEQFVELQKNGTFLQGELYFGRMSKDGKCYVIRSEEGYWIPVERYNYTVKGDMRKNFELKSTIYMRNRKRLNQFVSPMQYLTGENTIEIHSYRDEYNDVEL